jgi:acetyl-CoA C-acetyltransferase
VSVSPNRIPVIIGIGWIKDRPADTALGLEPMALVAEAIYRSEAAAKLLDLMPS